jgi:antitoxin ParD1/3/4
MTLNVSLTPQLEDLVRAKVASGLYTSASEVIREALRLFEEYEKVREARLRGLDSGMTEDASSSVAVEQVLAELRNR